MIGKSVGASRLTSQDEVAVDVGGDALEGLAGAFDEDLEHPSPHLDHLLHRQLEVGRLTLGATVRLVDQHAGVGEHEALVGRARGEQHRGGRGGLPHADRAHVGPEVLHRVVHREQRGHVATRAVDVERDVTVG